MAKAVNWQSRNQHLSGKIPFRLKSSCGQLKAGFRGEQGIYPSYPLTAARDASNLKAFLLLIVRIDATFSGHCLFSVCGEPLPHRACSIWPGWNREETAVRRPHSVSLCPEIGAPFPTACPAAGQHNGTIYREANRIYSGHRRIPARRPTRYSCRCHSCSTHAPASPSGGIADNS